MSFLLDPPLLVASGAVSELVFGNGPSAKPARNLAVGSFIAVSAALYANVKPIADRWPLLGARSGREFMLTSGLARIDENRISGPQHIAALSLFALYPAWFEAGRALARA